MWTRRGVGKGFSRKSTLGYVTMKRYESYKKVYSCPLEGGRGSKLGKIWSTNLLNDPVLNYYT